MTIIRERDPRRRAEDAVRAVLPRAAKVCVGDVDAGIDIVVNDHPFVIKWIGDGSGVSRHSPALSPYLRDE